ncbi:DUF7281 domain-containing protein [Aliidiomarina quisquiliarum]|uniref:DUF7281 domain-containing protein n=1 Tax=Aliidiomarina quisquiliarum TaxID=2938947 RepID=UPI00208E1E67|nr:Wadjet anti-phage system protein JetD domain-containing protein [Aliidiomarina quisquiliarum]MCO4321715.1 DUF2220 family protein [Aliidiomarina quisquiliarum]
MNRDLTRSERKLLQGLKVKLQSQSRVVRKLKATDLRVLSWCQQQDLIAHAISQKVEYGYTSELLHAIETRLSQLGLAPLEADLKQSSLDQAKQGAAEHKPQRVSPREQRVLRVAGQLIIDENHNQLELAQFSDLIVVENLDCFYELSLFKLPLTAHSLVIYRGDSHYGSGRAELLKRWKEGAHGPLKYFGDLDPQGLQIAISEGFSHLAVPTFNWFSSHATEQAYAAKQHDTAIKLQHTGELAPYIGFIQRYQRAVLQQWLQNVPLQWVVI